MLPCDVLRPSPLAHLKLGEKNNNNKLEKAKAKVCVRKGVWREIRVRVGSPVKCNARNANTALLWMYIYIYLRFMTKLAYDTSQCLVNVKCKPSQGIRANESNQLASKLGNVTICGHKCNG